MKNLKSCTSDYVSTSTRGNYNPQIWKSQVLRYLKYGNPEFYVERINDEDKSFYVVYTIDEGIRFIQELSFGSMLSSAGFKMARIQDNGDLVIIPFMFDGGKTGSAGNNSSNRRLFSKMSKTLGTIFTNEF
jgi:hypothetical protein